jgi:hypothetical protein
VSRSEYNGIVSVPAIVTALIARGSSLGTPIVLSRDLFTPVTYTITLTLSNFLGRSASATATFSLDGNPNLPIVSILGPATQTITPAEVLQLYTSVSQASCAEKASVLTYKWTVLKNGAASALASTSQAPTRFMLSTYALSAGNVYTIQFEATASATPNTAAIVGKATITVHVVNGAVNAVIRGGNKRIVPTVGTLTLDASASNDENVPPSQSSGLTYAWSCTYANPEAFGQTCAAVLVGVNAARSTLVVDATLFDATYLYGFQVIAKSADGRRAVATVTVQPQGGGSSTQTSISSLTTKVNPTAKIIIEATLQANYALDSAWTAYVDGTSASFTALTPVTDTLTRDQVKTGLAFPLVVPGSTFAAGSKVTFRLTANSAGAPDHFASYSEIAIAVNAPPTGGSVSVSPPSGSALSTLFTITALDWSDDPEDLPLTYSFRYQISASRGALTLQGRSLSNKVASNLPAGSAINSDIVTISCSAFDASLAEAVSTVDVTVSENADLDVGQYLADQLDSVGAVGNADAVGQVIGNVASTVNKVNCTLARPSYCASLNRGPCEDTSQTCSSCLDGFTGVFGDYNSLCLATRRRRLSGDIGDSCSDGGDCLLGLCEDSVCAAPVKSCPSVSDDVCSGHGTCVHATRSNQPIDRCLQTDSECNAHCHCEDGYGGRACSLPHNKLLSQDSIRTTLCNAVVTVGRGSDPSVATLMSLFGYLDAAFDADEVVSPAGVAACKAAMKYISALVTSNRNLLAEMDTTEVRKMVTTAAKFVTPKKADDRSDGSFINDLFAALHVAILGGMVNGQDSFTYAADNVRTLLTKAKIGAATALAPPHTAASDFYDASLQDSYIEIVDSSADSPFSSSDGYLALAVTLWGENPFPGAENIMSAMLRVENHNLASQRRRLVEEDAKRALATAPDYYIVLQMNEKQAFNFRYTREEAQQQGLSNVTFPECRHYDGAHYVPCTGCEVSTYTDYNITFACRAEQDRRMLSAGSSAVNQFGTVLVTPQAVAISHAPTAQPTSTPFSDGHKNTHALAIGLGVGLGGGGLLIIIVLAIYVWRSRQSNKLVPVGSAELDVMDAWEQNFTAVGTSSPNDRPAPEQGGDIEAGKSGRAAIYQV